MTMFRFASGLSSKLRLAENGIQRPVGGRLTWSRNYAGEDVKFSGPAVAAYDDKLTQMPKDADIEENSYLPSDVASCRQQVRNPSCDSNDSIKYALVMHQAMCSGGHKAVEGVNVMDLKYGIDLALEEIKKHLKCRTRIVSTFEEIAQVGTRAANGDGKIGEFIAEAMQKLGKEGLFIISKKKKKKLDKELGFLNSNMELEFVNGMKLNWHSISHPFIENQDQACVLKNPAVLIHENKISDDKVIKQAIGLVGYRRPLLIVTESIETEVVGSLILDRVCLKAKPCVVKPPDIQTNRKEIMQDLAILTGGRVAKGKNSCNFLPLMFGSCKEVRVLGSEMVILGGSGNREDIEKRCGQLRSAIKKSTSDSEVKLLEERLVKLSCGGAIFKVDGANKFEVQKNIKRVTNALNAAKAAVEEGIIPGGGVALLHASKELDKLQMTSSGGKICVQLLQHALKMPMNTIASVAGIGGSAVVEKLLEEDNLDLGYDPVTGEYVDMIKSGIVDPLKLVIEELDDFKRYFVTNDGDPLGWSGTRKVMGWSGTRKQTKKQT